MNKKLKLPVELTNFARIVAKITKIQGDIVRLMLARAITVLRVCQATLESNESG